MPDNPAVRLFHNIASGDLKSFDELHALFCPKLTASVLHLIKSREDTEEIVSDIFIHVWTSREQLIHIENPQSYLFTIARNKSINYLRQITISSQLVRQEITEELAVISNICPGRELETKELEKRITTTINGLPDQCRVIYLLIREQRMKYKDVASVLHISPRTVETQVSRARKKIREAIVGYVKC